MKTLKRSRCVKTVCFLLACIFLGLFTLNAACGIRAVLSDRLDLYSDPFFEDFADDVYGALARNFSERLRGKDVIYSSVENEGEEFFARNRTFTQGNTNFAFTVTDESGKVLLQNFTPKGTLGQYKVNTAVCVYQYPDGENTFIIYDDDRDPTSDYTEYDDHVTDTTEAEEQNTAQPESEAAPAETEPTGETAQPAETTLTAEVSESDTAPTGTMEPASEEDAAAAQEESEPAKTNTGRVNTDPVDRETEDVYIQDDTAQGYKSILMYIYPKEDGVDEDILNHCIDLYHKSFEPQEAQYYQRGTYEVYHQTDFAVSSNGTAYFIGTERSQADTTIAVPAPEPIDVKYYTLTVSVDSALEANDTARLASRAMGIAQGYLKHFAAITVISGLAALVFCILSLCLAGYVKGEEPPVARGLHRLPTDILFVIFASMAAAFCVLAADGIIDRGGMYLTEDWLVPLLLLPWLAVGMFACLYIFTVKVKSRTAVSSILLVRIGKWIVSLLRAASQALRIEWKLGLIMGAIYIAGGIVGLIVLAWGDMEHLLIVYVPYKIAELLLMLLLGINAYTLHAGAKALSEGKTGRIENRFLFGEFRRHAEYLNSIGDGVNAAIEQRMKSETTKTELITNVSHDLKTPLTSIVNYIDLLKKEPIDNPKAQEYITVIDRASQRLKKLTSDIVDASKAAAGSIQMTPEDIDLTVLLGQVRGEYDEKLAARGLQLLQSIPQTPLVVWADGRLLWRVFDNLMSNVAKYSMPNTRIYLTVTQSQGYAFVEFKNISETPLNIDPHTLTDRFVRGDASRNSEGSGLGLNIAQSLAQNMGGRLDLAIDGDLFKAMLVFPLKNA